jgi:RNA polymerase sigma-70 factor (ECF subfamily)
VRSSGLASATDAQLIEAATRGNAAAFSSLVRRYEEMVYRFSFKVCRNKVQAREALQDTFINVYRNLGSFDGRSKLSTWLYRIVTNNCLMKRRKRKMDDLLVSYDDPPLTKDGRLQNPVPRWEETPADLLVKKEFQELLEKALTRLPVEYRVVFVLRDIEGNSTEETARTLKLSVEATKSRLRRARAFLRQQLEPHLAIKPTMNR